MSELEALRECDRLGLHPLADPLGDSHHCDVDFSKEDREIGSALAYFLGTLFSDLDGGFDGSSIEEWSRVARALRIHKLAITDRF